MTESGTTHEHTLEDANAERAIDVATWVRRGVRMSDAELQDVQPRWDIDPTAAIIADIGHHLEAPGVIEQSVEAIEAGACAIHLHILDEDGNETTDFEVWADTLDEIRSRTDADPVINGGFRGDSFDEQMNFVREGLFDVVPCPIEATAPDYVKPALEVIQANGAKFKFGVSDPTDVLIAKNEYIDPGLVDAPTLWGIFLGAPYRGIPMEDPRTMARGLLYTIELIENVDPNAVISVTAQGRAGSYLSSLGLLLGYNAKVGIGETRWRHPHTDERLTRNSVAVEDAVSVLRGLGREPASAAQYRDTIGT